MAATTVKGRCRTMWRMKLHSSFRAALACTIVGCTTLYGPAYLTRQITFPAFSYATAILIVSDANLGDTIRGCWHALYATIQVLPISILGLKVIGPARFTPGIAAGLVALTSFLVALPNSTHVMSKRIGFGQLVIVCVDAVIHGKQYSGVMVQPVHVASSTALGAISAFLALLLPYPLLAYYEVRKLNRLYIENAKERINLYLNASIAENQITAMELISQAKPLAAIGHKLLSTITLMQEGILWEMPWLRFLKPHFVSPGDRLEGMETLMKGMEIALNFCPLKPSGLATQELTDTIMSLSVQIGQKLEQASCFLPFNSTTVPEPRGCLDKLILPSCNTILSDNNNDLSAFFFSSCLDQFLNDSTTRQEPKPNSESHTNERGELRYPQEYARKETCRRWISNLWNERLLIASKYSLSLGLAVLIGLIFNKENGYWAGLAIAISFATERQAIFTVANARAQGTAIGSVYGVLGSFVFKKVAQIRFVALIPWIIFTSFLRHSRMYGQAGGISAVIGALLILGRKNYGTPDEFAIARLTEAIIGLCCFILVELLLQPTRASTLVKRQLYLSLGTIEECITQLIIYSAASMDLQAFKEKQQHLKSHVQEFENFIEQAELEPNFWFFPFRNTSYWKLHDSLSNMTNLLQCMAYSLEFLLQIPQNNCAAWKELQECIHHDLEFSKDILCSSLRCLEKMNSLIVAPELDQGKIFHDLEKRNFTSEDASSILITGDHQVGKIRHYTLQQSRKGVDDITENEDKEGLGQKMIIAYCSLCFCINCFRRETTETKRVIKEVIQWEKTTS
ncbi:hypothetical protein ACH5RR_004846 [Cinchona calisaya]|uniref:Integral membrane bound transporter domain-containing protein n=1 Tax=Cinchona calisaya TaxID=153742 RepID=A0ABD3AYS1_9GENT